MARFSVLTISDEDADQARAILGPGIDLEQAGAVLTGEVDLDRIAALGQAGLLVTIEPEPAADQPAAATAVSAAAAGRFNPLAEMARDDPSLGVPEAISYSTATVTGALTAERAQWMADNGLELGARLGPSRYVTRIDTDRWDGLAPAWLSTGHYGVAETIGDAVAPEQVAVAAARKEGGGIDDAGDPTIRTYSDIDRASPDDAFRRFDMEVDMDGLAAGGGTAVATPAIYDASCHPPHTPADLKALLDRDPRVIEAVASASRVRVTAADPDGAFFADLAGLAMVDQAEPYVPIALELTYATGVVTGGRPRPAGLTWKGAGEIIGIADSGVDQEHPDLIGRVKVKLIAQPPSDRDPHGHGTHVASIAAGDGAASGGELTGMAPEATLYVQSLLNTAWAFELGNDGIGELLADAYAENVRIQNFSFGAAVAGRYTIDARELDRFVYDHEDMLVVVAGGNEGEQSATDPGKRIALRSLASPASAKNCLTVGASGTTRPDGPYAGLTWSAYDGKRPPQAPPMGDRQIAGDGEIIAPLSSRGPTQEGRLKPDLVAPGVCIAAARSADSTPDHPTDGFGDHYCYKTGTSMAAPLVAGAAAVLRQYLREARGHQPTATLLKACLINSARWLTGTDWEDPQVGEPNFHQGYGLMSLARVIPAADATFALLFDDVRNGADEALTALGRPRWSRTFKVKAGTPVSATMTWLDAGARGLQSDLELTLIDPAGKRYVGNAGLTRAPYDERDIRNNVKRVFVPAPAAGAWAAHVTAFETSRAQGFALAMTGDLAD